MLSGLLSLQGEGGIGQGTDMPAGHHLRIFEVKVLKTIHQKVMNVKLVLRIEQDKGLHTIRVNGLVSYVSYSSALGTFHVFLRPIHESLSPAMPWFSLDSIRLRLRHAIEIASGGLY